MKGRLKRLLPRNIAGQIALLVVASLLLAHAITAATFILVSPQTQTLGSPIPTAARLATLARILQTTGEPATRRAVLAAAGADMPGLGLAAAADLSRPFSVQGPLLWLVGMVEQALGPGSSAFVAAPEPGRAGPGLRLAIRLGDGSILLADLPDGAGWPFSPSLPIIGTLIFLATTLTLLSLWAARGLVAPLAGFAIAAERFSLEGRDVALPDGGPVEIARAARAFNEMRERIRALVEGRTRMLAAVSHDLRTPVTRLHLRAEDIPDEILRAQVLADLGVMERMIQAALSYLRDQHLHGLQLQKVDLPALLQTLCDGFADLGLSVHYAGPDHLTLACDPDQITRAVSNLVDNAVKFGTAASVWLDLASVDEAVIAVEDDGPGLTESEKELAVEPFYRGDASRSLDGPHAGFGLGLAIARSIANLHGGRLVLADTPSGGLSARLHLPRQPGGRLGRGD